MQPCVRTARRGQRQGTQNKQLCPAFKRCTTQQQSLAGCNGRVQQAACSPHRSVNPSFFPFVPINKATARDKRLVFKPSYAHCLWVTLTGATFVQRGWWQQNLCACCTPARADSFHANRWKSWVITGVTKRASHGTAWFSISVRGSAIHPEGGDISLRAAAASPCGGSRLKFVWRGDFCTNRAIWCWSTLDLICLKRCTDIVITLHNLINW